MKNQMLAFLKSKKTIYTILILIITLQLIYITDIFATQKEGFHSDEMYSYGLSNSYHNPFLSIDGHALSGKFQNVNEWISGSTLNDYLVVNDGEAFDYSNVWYNQSLDRHPPLYYSILHTICSFFPNQFSPWFGFSINLAVLIVLDIFLFLLARRLLKSDYLGLLTCLCYGFSVGAVNTFVYIRMYAFMIMLTVMLAYLHSQLLDIKGKIPIKLLVLISLNTFFGTLTQHEFTIIAFVFAVCFCIYYLSRKEFKSFTMYGCSMALGVLIALCIFPPLLSQIFSESGGSAIDVTEFFHQIYLSFIYMNIEILGLGPITQGDLVYYLMVVPAFVLAIVIFAIPICFLLRKNKIFKKLTHSIKTGILFLGQKIKTLRFGKVVNRILSSLKHTNLLSWVLLLSVLTIVIITSYSVDYRVMGYCDRYLFVVFPFFLIISILICNTIIGKIKIIKKFKNIAITLIFAIFLMTNIISPNFGYLFEGTKNIDLQELTKGSECIILEDDYADSWRLVCYTNLLNNAEHIFLTNYEDIEALFDKIDSLKTDNSVYLLLESDHKTIYDKVEDKYTFYAESFDDESALSEEEFLEKYFSRLNFYDKAELIGRTRVFSLNYLVYRIA